MQWITDQLEETEKPIRARLGAPALAVAAVSIAAVSLWTGGDAARAIPVPVAVMRVEVDPARPDLEAVSRALTDALIGAVASEAGDRARVLSPHRL